MASRLVGLRTFGSSFYHLLASVLHDLTFFPSKADPDIWMHDRKDHWGKYFATFVDKLFYTENNSDTFFQSLLDIRFELIEGSMPKYHLGGDFKRAEMPE
jgi:hypothetical protein